MCVCVHDVVIFLEFLIFCARVLEYNLFGLFSTVGRGCSSPKFSPASASSLPSLVYNGNGIRPFDLSVIVSGFLQDFSIKEKRINSDNHGRCLLLFQG